MNKMYRSIVLIGVFGSLLLPLAFCSSGVKQEHKQEALSHPSLSGGNAEKEPPSHDREYGQSLHLRLLPQGSTLSPEVRDLLIKQNYCTGDNYCTLYFSPDNSDFLLYIEACYPPITPPPPHSRSNTHISRQAGMGTCNN